MRLPHSVSLEFPLHCYPRWAERDPILVFLILWFLPWPCFWQLTPAVQDPVFCYTRYSSNHVWCGCRRVLGTASICLTWFHQLWFDSLYLRRQQWHVQRRASAADCLTWLSSTLPSFRFSRSFPSLPPPACPVRVYFSPTLISSSPPNLKHTPSPPALPGDLSPESCVASRYLCSISLWHFWLMITFGTFPMFRLLLPWLSWKVWLGRVFFIFLCALHASHKQCEISISVTVVSALSYSRPTVSLCTFNP